MTWEPEPDVDNSKPAKRKSNRVGWIAALISVLAALATVIDKNTPANDRGLVRGFESRYDQQRAAAINCAGTWGEERKVCHALFGD